MRRILLVLTVALVMAAMMLAMAMPAFAQGGAAERCGPPGQTVNGFAMAPGQSTTETWGEAPGQDVATDCAPGQQEPI
jgi:hypothetical protein